jgi:hypothetical protein
MTGSCCCRGDRRRSVPFALQLTARVGMVVRSRAAKSLPAPRDPLGIVGSVVRHNRGSEEEHPPPPAAPAGE